MTASSNRRTKLISLITVFIFAVSLFSAPYVLYYSGVTYMNWIRSLVDKIKEAFESSEIDYGFPIVIPSKMIISNVLTGTVKILPAKSMSNASFMIFIKGEAGQPLKGVEIYIASQDNVYGPFITTDKPYTVTEFSENSSYQVEVYPGLLIFRNFKEGSYVVSGYYKGYTVEKRIFVQNQHGYDLTFPVFVEVFGVPMSFPLFVIFLIGVVLLIIVVAVIISEYSFWRRIQLERRLRKYLKNE